MNKNQNAYYFLLFCLFASLLIMFFIIRPFLMALVMAAVFAFLFQPVYRSFLKITRGSEGVSALASTLAAVVLVVLPVSFLGALIFRETTELFRSVSNEESLGFIEVAENAVDGLRAVFPVPDDFEINLSEYAQRGLEILTQNLGAIFSGFAKMILNIFVFLTAFYFFLKDGEKLKDYFVDLSPLSDSDDELIVSRLKAAVSAAVKGNLSIGFIQGILTGIGFAIFGVPNPALWGGVAAITAMIPGIGTSIVLLPGVAFLFFVGSIPAALGLLAWGMIAVGMIDNFLGPRLVGRGMHLHPLAIFLAVLGGLIFFGPLGFLLGPIAMSVCLALIEIYFSLRGGSDIEIVKR
jgi:predicted PurR-regulated permease PerM